jgi:hypothetical protein
MNIVDGVFKRERPSRKYHFGQRKARALAEEMANGCS